MNLVSYVLMELKFTFQKTQQIRWRIQFGQEIFSEPLIKMQLDVNLQVSNIFLFALWSTIFKI